MKGYLSSHIINTHRQRRSHQRHCKTNSNLSSMAFSLNLHYMSNQPQFHLHLNSLHFYLSLNRFYTCTACSDPGIVFLTPVGGNSTHSENGDDIVGVARGDPGCDVGCSPGSECSEGGETKKKRVHIRRDSSPGVGVGNGASASLVGRMECGQCHVSRPVTAAHCYECGVCVDELDHHCPVRSDRILKFILWLIS